MQAKENAYSSKFAKKQQQHTSSHSDVSSVSSYASSSTPRGRSSSPSSEDRKSRLMREETKNRAKRLSNIDDEIKQREDEERRKVLEERKLEKERQMGAARAVFRSKSPASTPRIQEQQPQHLQEEEISSYQYHQNNGLRVVRGKDVQVPPPSKRYEAKPSADPSLYDSLDFSQANGFTKPNQSNEPEDIPQSKPLDKQSPPAALLSLVTAGRHSSLSSHSSSSSSSSSSSAALHSNGPRIVKDSGATVIKATSDSTLLSRLFAEHDALKAKLANDSNNGNSNDYENDDKDSLDGDSDEIRQPLAEQQQEPEEVEIDLDEDSLDEDSGDERRQRHSVRNSSNSNKNNDSIESAAYIEAREMLSSSMRRIDGLDLVSPKKALAPSSFSSSASSSHSNAASTQLFMFAEKLAERNSVSVNDILDRLPQSQSPPVLSSPSPPTAAVAATPSASKIPIFKSRIPSPSPTQPTPSKPAFVSATPISVTYGPSSTPTPISTPLSRSRSQEKMPSSNSNNITPSFKVIDSPSPAAATPSSSSASTVKKPPRSPFSAFGTKSPSSDSSFSISTPRAMVEASDDMCNLGSRVFSSSSDKNSNSSGGLTRGQSMPIQASSASSSTAVRGKSPVAGRPQQKQKQSESRSSTPSPPSSLDGSDNDNSSSTSNSDAEDDIMSSGPSGRGRRRGPAPSDGPKPSIPPVGPVNGPVSFKKPPKSPASILSSARSDEITSIQSDPQPQQPQQPLSARHIYGGSYAAVKLQQQQKKDNVSPLSAQNLTKHNSNTIHDPLADISIISAGATSDMSLHLHDHQRRKTPPRRASPFLAAAALHVRDDGDLVDGSTVYYDLRVRSPNSDNNNDGRSGHGPYQSYSEIMALNDDSSDNGGGNNDDDDNYSLKSDDLRASFVLPTSSSAAGAKNRSGKSKMRESVLVRQESQVQQSLARLDLLLNQHKQNLMMDISDDQRKGNAEEGNTATKKNGKKTLLPSKKPSSPVAALPPRSGLPRSPASSQNSSIVSSPSAGSSSASATAPAASQPPIPNRQHLTPRQRLPSPNFVSPARKDPSPMRSPSLERSQLLQLNNSTPSSATSAPRDQSPRVTPPSVPPLAPSASSIPRSGSASKERPSVHQLLQLQRVGSSPALMPVLVPSQTSPRIARDPSPQHAPYVHGVSMDSSSASSASSCAAPKQEASSEAGRIMMRASKAHLLFGSD